jgi:HAD superfamily hydrolase (TIGR01490 family)
MTRTTAAFFDLDKTMIARSSTLALTRPFYRDGLISRAAVIRGAFAQVVFRMTGADHERMERIRSEVSGLCKGWPAERVREIVRKNLDQRIMPHVYTEAEALVSAHRDAGQDVIIVSTAGHEVVDPIAALLGADRVIATQMEVADGHYTGDMAFYAYGEGKAARMRDLAAERGYRLPECYAYSDSITDLPMLEAVGHPNAVNPDRALRRVAAERGWPVLSFTAPSQRARPQPRQGREAEPPARDM